MRAFVILNILIIKKIENMKNFILIFSILLALNSNAQIVLEHTYDSASTQASAGYYGDQLMLINFEYSGERYVKVCRTGKYISVYDLNHAFIKKISTSGLPYWPVSHNADFLYISEHLFNDDNKIEFMYIAANGSLYYTGIYNEDGTLIFSDTGVVMIRANFEQQQMPIYNTSQGTKMILSYRYGKAKVFSLPGTLSEDIAEANGQLLQQNGEFSNLYPNPSNGAVTLQYELPEGETEGELVLYDLQGTEVKRYTVDNTFKNIVLNNSELASGTYFYQLISGKGVVGVKKMVVVQ
jgi:hypothetical protein